MDFGTALQILGERLSQVQEQLRGVQQDFRTFREDQERRANAPAGELTPEQESAVNGDRV